MKIKLNNNIDNSSLQIGDKAYHATINSDGFGSDPVEIGEITGIGTDYIEVKTTFSTPSADDFIMFSKNTAVNNSSLLGYYAEVKLTNDSRDKAELFTLGSEVVESSK
tara:strand:+ start:225 stop:548 length:324 start_codon:yes stop_codon:yes gene_type:complete